MVKQSCFFANICGCEFSKKHKKVNLFSLQLCDREYMLNICVKRALDIVGYFLKSLGDREKF